MVKTSEILIKDTSELITKDRIRNYMDLWNYHLPISPYEVAGIKMNANAAGNNISLILNGFKSMDSFSYTYLMDKAVFAYPTDSEVRGSTRAFLALYRSMLKKNVMGIGELLVRKTAASRQVCIIPHQGDLYASEAFLILQLPYREEVRKVPTHSQSADDHDALAKCTNLLQQQTISGEIDFRNSFPNPSLKNYWSFIESIALNMPLDQRTTHCFNSFDNFANPPSDAIEAFRASLPEDEIPTKTAKKRAVKEKTPDTTGIDWETAYETDKSNGTDTCLSKYKNDSMKDFLRSVGEKVSGNKGELVARIKAYFKAREP
jgi:ATP-dependent DNA helicase 2 subunit 1